MENEKKRELLKGSLLILLMSKKRGLLQSVQMAYIMPKTSKITKIHELPLLHRG